MWQGLSLKIPCFGVITERSERVLKSLLYKLAVIPSGSHLSPPVQQTCFFRTLVAPDNDGFW